MSNIQLYAVGTTGDGSAATAMLKTAVQSDSGGNFSITSDYTCGSASQPVYLVVTGGNPGLGAGTNNTALALMAALGSCGSLSASTHLIVDEVTTVGSIAALYPYMSAYASIGSATTDASSLATAFNTVNEYTNVSVGTAPGPTLPAGYYASSTDIDTLGDIVAGCINSAGGAAGDGSACGQLFTLTTPTGGKAPTDTVGAILNILKNPTLNVAAIFNLGGAYVPFQPMLGSAPSSWSLPIVPIAATPIFSEPGGGYTAIQYISLSSATSGASIYYTMNGTTPTAASTLYAGPIAVGSTETIQAIAVASGYASSGVANASYFINLPAAAAPAFSLAPGSYFTSAQTVSLTSTTPNSVIYYTVNGTIPTIASTLYTGAITVSASETITAIAAASGYTNSPVASAGYYINEGFGTITTIAGTGNGIYNGDGEAATSANLGLPSGVAVDPSGNVYLSESYNHRVRKVTPAGIISTIAGTGVAGFSGDGGPGASAQINTPYKVALDSSGNLYIAEFGGQRVRKLTPAGIISTVAGTGTAGFSGDGGPATAAAISNPDGITLDSSGNLYIADSNNIRVREVNTLGIISTFAGNGSQGASGDGGPATAASILSPTGVSVDSSGNLYISEGCSIRKVNTLGVISTIAGGNAGCGYYSDNIPATAASLNYPQDLAVDSAGDIYIADDLNQRIRVIKQGYIFTIAGTGTAGFGGDAGVAGAGLIHNPSSVTTDSAGNIYIADTANQRIRKVTFGVPPPAATPVFSLAAGTYTGAQKVSITDTTPGATIYYTTDGSTPTTSSPVYTAAITVSATETVQAIAAASQYANSSVASAVYTIH